MVTILARGKSLVVGRTPVGSVGHPVLLLASLLGLAIATLACRPGPAAPRTSFSLHQKGQFQALYDGSGRMVRLLQDSNGDGRAEVVVVFGPKGRPERGEMDTNGDGVVDRREHFAPDGTLLRVDEK